MSAFETIVRPALPVDSAPGPQPYVTPSQPSNPNVFIFAGRSGRGIVYRGSYSRTITFYLAQKVVEQSS